MAVKKVLVLDDDGNIEELQSGDTLQDSSPDLGTFTAGENLVLGDWVYVSAANTVSKAQADDEATMPCIGVAIETINNTESGTIRLDGVMTGLSSLTAGDVYYVDHSSAGAIVSTTPSSSGHVIQRVGTAISTTELQIDFGALIKRS